MSLFAAVGKWDFRSQDSKFCTESGVAGHDHEGNPLWQQFGAEQRDVFFFYRNDEGELEFYCKYSMDQYSSDFSQTLDDVLAKSVGEKTETSPASTNKRVTGYSWLRQAVMQGFMTSILLWTWVVML